MILKENKKRYMGGFSRRKGNRDIVIKLYSQKMKEKFEVLSAL